MCVLTEGEPLSAVSAGALVIGGGFITTPVNRGRTLAAVSVDALWGECGFNYTY